MSSVTPADQPSDRLSIAIVGNDALIEALPARPIQFAHACRAAGFDLVLPESWGDELVADTTLRRLEERAGPAVFCACPIVRERLLASGVELVPLLINTAAPSVATARYARALYGSRVNHVAYIGNCPAGNAPEFDVHHLTEHFLRLLRDRGIDVLAQPDVYDAVLPPDRRRFASLPGGCPSPEALWNAHQRALIGVHAGGEDFAIELAQQLLAHQSVLVDVAPALGCACSGVTRATPGQNARIAVMSLEPPRASAPVVDPDAIGPQDQALSPMFPHGQGGPRRPYSATLAESETREPARVPIAVTPPGALVVQAVGPRSTTESRAIASIRGAFERASEIAPRPIFGQAQAVVAPIPREKAITGEIEPPVVAPAPISRSRVRPASGGIPTVRLSDPATFRVPRAYLTRRPLRASTAKEAPTPPPPRGPEKAPGEVEAMLPVAGAAPGEAVRPQPAVDSAIEAVQERQQPSESAARAATREVTRAGRGAVPAQPRGVLTPLRLTIALVIVALLAWLVWTLLGR